MRVHLLSSGKFIEPFGLRAEDCALGGRTLGAQRDEVLARLGLEVTRGALDDDVEGPCLVLEDDVWISRRALKLWLKVARAGEETCRLALERERFVELTAPLQDLDERAECVAYDVAFVPAGARLSAADALASDNWLAHKMRVLDVAVPAPKYLLGTGTDEVRFPISSSAVMRIRHWVHLLRASHFAPVVELLDRVWRNPVAASFRALPALRLNKRSRERALRAAFVYQGKGAWVHPSSTVEASILGDDVVVGPHCYITGSILGDGTVVEQRAHIEQSTLGPRTFVSKNSSLSACLTFGDTDVCVNGIQTCVVGTACGLTSFARPLDLVPGGEVRVVDNGKLRGVGELPCGVCFGPECFVGADVVIAPGRAIPRGVRLVAPPEDALRKPPGEHAGLGYIKDGAFVPIG